MIAHDIRGPLTGLLGLGELFIEGMISSEDVPETIASMVNSGRRLASIADELSLFARLEGGDYEPDRQSVDLVAMLNDLRSYLPGGERIDVECTGDCVVSTDSIAVRHVFENLLGNALKYSGSGARVSAALCRARDAATFRVTDRGIGIPAGDLEHVFDRRTRASNAGAIKGTGLGLSFVRRLLAACGGSIAVESTVNVGSTFTVTLPADQA